MKKASVFSGPVMIVLGIIILAFLIIFVIYLLGGWGTEQVKGVVGGLDVSKYI